MMDNTINGRTPDEIKKALEICSNSGIWDCDACPYGDSDDGWGCRSDLYEAALAYIKQLEYQLADAGKKVEQLKRERDAAVEDLETMGEAMANCDTCLYNNTNYNEEPCIRCMSGYLINKWQWRGVQEDE